MSAALFTDGWHDSALMMPPSIAPALIFTVPAEIRLLTCGCPAQCTVRVQIILSYSHSQELHLGY
jgi:hypothetical protein